METMGKGLRFWILSISLLCNGCGRIGYESVALKDADIDTGKPEVEPDGSIDTGKAEVEPDGSV